MRLQSAYSDCMTEVYLLFFHASLQVFVNFNKFMQREDPIIPVLNDQILEFLKRLFSKFVTVADIKSAPTVTSINFDRENQLPSELIMIIQ